MKENMINLNDLPDFSDNHVSEKPYVVIGIFIAMVLVKTATIFLYTGNIMDTTTTDVAMSPLHDADIVLSIALHIFQFILTIAGLVAFRWAWKDRQKNKGI